ncbi:MAG: HAD family phosphatase [Saprospiraceae bacterium]
MSTIKNIIFDLGNVIIDLDIPRTTQEMGRLMRHPDKQNEVWTALQPTFHLYETGLISDELFINAFIQHARPQVYAQQVIRAWNAMLIDIPVERLQFLTELKKLGYQIYLLSNTNGIHLEWVNNYMNKHHRVASLEPWFDKTYYSHLMRKRKPDTACFKYVLEDAGLDQEETLFIDDIHENIIGAQEAGIRGLHLTGGHDIVSALKSYLSL